VCLTWASLHLCSLKRTLLGSQHLEDGTVGGEAEAEMVGAEEPCSLSQGTRPEDPTWAAWTATGSILEPRGQREDRQGHSFQAFLGPQHF
jgi:hypothetical protein